MNSDIVEALGERLGEHRRALEGLVRIPSVSAPGFDPAHVATSAQACATLLEDCGLENVRIVADAGSHPNVVADWLHAPGAPTVLLYAHHDVQPAGISGNWTTPPFEPAERDGRLYGRGTADDKAGVVAHAACVRAWLDARGRLPVNVKVLVEGEEEIGSPNLASLLAGHADELAADVLVLADAGNWDVGAPALTYSLRGVGSATVTISALQGPVHSGMAGGLVPDPLMELARLLASLTDENGDIAVDGFSDDVRPPGDEERARVLALADDAVERRARAAWGFLDGVTMCGDPSVPMFERLWARPSVTVIGLDAHPIAGSSNQVLARAAARLSVRFAPGQDPQRCLGLLGDHLAARVPFGLHFEYSVGEAVPAWVCEPTGAAFDAARAALAAGYGTEPVLMGVGGSIPFVGPFAAAFGGAPALLVGPADPRSRVHGEDESLHLDDWRKLIESEVHLMAALAGAEAGAPTG